MSAATAPALSQFALDVMDGLSRPGQKQLSPAYLYDDLGSVLFDAITLLPEYGLTRADERLLRRFAPDIVKHAGTISCVTELGSGTGKKTRHILQEVCRAQQTNVYFPIDVSGSALQRCALEMSEFATVRTIERDWIQGLAEAQIQRPSLRPMLLLFLGSSIGNIERKDLPHFLQSIRQHLKTGDFFLIGADLVKPVAAMTVAYDDPTGVTAAFNRNILGRINRELLADFNLASFRHEARWNEAGHRIEMHLVATSDQAVYVQALSATYKFPAGESIWTESSQKFTPGELNSYAAHSGFAAIHTWVDAEWPFAEALWRAI